MRYSVFMLLLMSAQMLLANQRHLVELQRNPDYACTQCHQELTLGKHGHVTNPNNGLAVTCTNCHGNISPQHRNGVADVMRFDPHETLYRVEQQNAVCFSCHSPEKLREVFWPHDVHAAKLSCSNCHTLHTPIDPMQAINAKEQIKLCVDCHSEQHKQRLKP